MSGDGSILLYNRAQGMLLKDEALRIDNWYFFCHPHCLYEAVYVYSYV